jgi:hypothetical protein
LIVFVACFFWSFFGFCVPFMGSFPVEDANRACGEAVAVQDRGVGGRIQRGGRSGSPLCPAESSQALSRHIGQAGSAPLTLIP